MNARNRGRPTDGLPKTLGSRLVAALPKGGSLPVDEWNRRHKFLLAVLWLNTFGLPLYGVASGYGFIHTLEHLAGLVVLAGAASVRSLGMKFRSLLVSLGLLTSCALLVHLTGGLIETHFYFFVVIVALTLYEDWLPFLIAVAFVLLHHGVAGTIAPEQVYSHADAVADPWLWAGIHAAFVGLAGVAGVTAWRLNESVRERMKEVQVQLEAISETDALTGLANRRRVMADLDESCGPGASPSVLVVLDLDGFKSYNDTFGHPAGDALLIRLGAQLTRAIGDHATVYRLGGDEFCVLGPGGRSDRAMLQAIASAALSERGDAFAISASYGSALIPEEAESPSAAMRLADERMYARKESSRRSAGTQSRDVLLKALTERYPDLAIHSSTVRELVQPVAALLEVTGPPLTALLGAAELHDVGKVAIPDAILRKPGALDETEWNLMRSHTLIGERIVSAAPALTGVGEIIRSSHERWDGTGYPDRLAQEEIPLGARIITACDAYDAMTSDRPYRSALSREDALAELRRRSGAQFDPTVVRVLVRVLTREGGAGKKVAGVRASAATTT